VKPVLNNLAIIIRWYLKYKDFHLVSKPGAEEETEMKMKIITPPEEKIKPKGGMSKKQKGAGILLLIFIGTMILVNIFNGGKRGPVPIPFDPTNVAFSDSRDNQVYSEVKIGTQIWMGENLRATTFNDGTPIAQVKGTDEWASLLTPAYCWYDNDRSAYKDTYGPLYNWYAVNSGKLCPIGWHAPTNAEWDTLELFLDPGIDTVFLSREPVAGTKLKERGNLHWQLLDSLPGTNESGFSALPAGCRTVYGVFWGVGERAGFWSSTEVSHSPADAESREIREGEGSNNLFDFGNYKKFGFSVRCIKDKPRN